ncbi:methyl-accepting chemotaxis protein [Litoribacillus peritrichatus]|uniref:Chemotaxis chemoreceptor PilJ n=1 Tax=Litoribacillus peritrichatus TaxID=718191 RepID=A0ABP7MRA7_9GAMM
MKPTGGINTNKLFENPLMGGSLVLMVLAIIGLFVTSWIQTVEGARDKEYLANAGELRVLSQAIAKNSTEAAGGKEEAFKQLQISREAFELHWDNLLNGNPDVDLPSSPESVKAEMDGLQDVWGRVRDNADQILESQEVVLTLHEVAATLSETIPQLQIEYEEVVEILLEVEAPAEQVVIAQKQSLLAERIVRSVNKVLAGGDDAVLAADNFGRDASLFGRVMNGMLEGNVAMNISQVEDEEAVFSLEEISDLFEFVSGSVDEILDNSPDLFHVRESANSIFLDSQALLDRSSALSVRFQKLSDDRPFYKTAVGVYLCLILLFVGGAGYGYVVFKESEKERMEEAESNEQNQTAILRLLDEIADLADGDLTTQATVTEDFTGAIADSINFAIDQMRGLVSAINETAVQVSAAAQETQATAMHLAEASEHQAQEIAGASAAINEMAVSIDQVSANAAESSAVAERSVAIANKGAEVVQNTINGMDTIREQIQETSKRIKRLGESSQEIGDIVSLINDIADQTNILSLNAAIQASMAGEAGRGFAVVADEVQRLAERSAAATKQIESLVKAIQSDTNEAVISMEQTTSEVVTGARLAQDAGVALEEIETVSKNLADLIQNISNAARQQASSAGHISNTMNVIQEITSQTSSGTTATAKSIGNLAELANHLRESVAGFKLPDSELAAIVEEEHA